MIHHEAAILNDLDSGLGKCFSDGGVANTGLQPYCFRHLCQNVFDVSRNVLGAAEDIYQININGNVDQTAINLLPEYLGNLRKVNGYGNNFKAGAL